MTTPDYFFPGYYDHCRYVGPSWVSWRYAILVHGACCLLGGIPCGLLLYRWRRSNTTSTTTTTKPSGDDENPTAAPLLCYLVAIAGASSVILLRPYIESVAPNEDVRFFGPFVASACGFSTFFKACNAGTGVFPEGADRDLSTWMQWFTMLPEPAFAKGKTVRASPREVLSRFRDACGKILVMAVLLTVLLPKGPPSYDLVGAGEDEPWTTQLLAEHANGFVHVWLLYAFASFCLDFSAVLDMGLSGGRAMNPGFANPLLASRSLREVWGTRWNQTVHELLKRGIYVPLRRRSSFGPTAAAVATFLGSGLLHEYTFRIHNHRAISDGVYVPGSVTVFFLVMGGLMLAESWVWHNCLPRPVRSVLGGLPSVATASLLLFLVSGLAERWFLRSWTASGWIETIAEMIPHLDCRVGGDVAA